MILAQHSNNYRVSYQFW